MSVAESRNSRWLFLDHQDGELVIALTGVWRLESLTEIDQMLTDLTLPTHASLIVDGSRLESWDTAGAMMLIRFIDQAFVENAEVAYRGFTESQAQILQLVRDRYSLTTREAPRCRASMLEEIGETTLVVINEIINIFSFIGHTGLEAMRLLRSPRLFRGREFFVQLEQVCLNAIPIVFMVTMLIGVVVAYLFATVSEKYGANIYVVESVGLAMCRELSPLIVAIIVAGRSGSAFTAQIGTMKLNEEIDAMQTLGFSPMQVLVMPRFFALVLTMPLLVFIGDLAGIFGGMLIADFRLGITEATFMDRLQTMLKVRHVLVGLIKAPVYAAFIADIGCRLGLNVENNARSVGINTTATVVQSIVSVILLNALFAVIFVELGI